VAEVRLEHGVSAGWQTLDIGARLLPGRAEIRSGGFAVSGSGFDIWGTNDHFRFVYRERVGDGVLTVRLDRQTRAHAWSKAGAMIRDGLSAESRHAIMLLSSANGTRVQGRERTGSGSVTSLAGALTNTPCWLRIERLGDTLTGYESADGASWRPVGACLLTGLSNATYWGLAVTSHDTQTWSTAEFSELAINATATLAPLPDLTVRAGSRMVLTPAVHDQDVPAQTFTFSLDTAPSGASVDPVSGILSWRPILGHAGGDYPFLVTVRDNGVPPLQTGGRFSVHVPMPMQPSLGIDRSPSGAIRVSADGDPGLNYELQSSSNLVHWVSRWTTNPPTVPFDVLDRETTGQRRGYYRMRIRP